MLAVVICLTGAFLILDVWNSSWQGISWIDLLAMCSGLGLAMTNILFRFTQGIPLISKVSFMFIGCTVIMAIAIGASSGSFILPENNSVPLAMAYGAIWLTLITIGTQWGVTQMEAGRSAIIIVMELVVAVVSVAVITMADLKTYEIVGGLMVLSAAILEGSRSESELVAVKQTAS